MILALSTNGQMTHMTLLTGESNSAPTIITEAVWESGRELADHLLERLHALLEDNDATWTNLTGLIIFSGPGSFTSLRIGHTVMNTLAASLGLPIVGAKGDAWMVQGCTALASAPTGQPVWPEYGGEANITSPRKA